MEDEYSKLIRAYREKFGKGPPLWELPVDEAIRQMREALKTGTVLSSFIIEDFGNERLRTVTIDEVNERLEKFKGFIS